MDLVMVKEAMMDILGGSGDYGLLQKSTSNEQGQRAGDSGGPIYR